MEPTYFWDALSDDAIEWLNAEHARPVGRSGLRDVPDFLVLPPAGRAGSASKPLTRFEPRQAGLVRPPEPTGCLRSPSDRDLIRTAASRRIVASRSWACRSSSFTPSRIDRPMPNRDAEPNPAPIGLWRVGPGGWVASWSFAGALAATAPTARRHRPDLGRALVPDQPTRLGPLVGGAWPMPGARADLDALLGARGPALLLALRPIRLQLPPAAGRAVEPPDARDLRPAG